MGWLLVALVVYFSLTPAPPSLPMDGGDKLGHVLAYAALMAWFSWLYSGLGMRLVCAVGFVILGIGLEFAQALTDYRSFQLADMGADCVGARARVDQRSAGPPQSARLPGTPFPGR
ncbi:MAG: VanZ family protein [Comamonadaceae bacterium]|nr:VanZ family protein [Comamonadaceae bacterium]